MERLELIRKLNKAGICSSLKGDDGTAILIYKHALKIDPFYPNLHYNLATSYIKKGMELHAIEELKKYLRSEPETEDTNAVFEKIEKLQKKILTKESILLNKTNIYC